MIAAIFLQLQSFVPHGYCIQWNWQLMLLHIVSDALIAIAYMSIPVTLVYFVRQRKDLPFHWIFMLFGIFIVACGLTHVMEIWTLWHANYWLSGAIKGVTAAASVTTALLLVNIVPAALALPRPEELRAANQALADQSETLKRQAQQIESARAESDLFINCVPSILIGTDTKGRIVRWNHAAERTFGLTQEEVTGKMLQDCGIKWLSEETPAEIASWSGKPLPHRPPVLGFDNHGERRHLGLTVNDLVISAERTKGLLITGSDISDRLLLEGQLRQAQKLEAIGQLAAGIAHEINTPTQYVGDNVSFVKESWTALDELLRLTQTVAAEPESAAISPATFTQLQECVRTADLEYLLAEIPKSLEQTLDGVQRVAKIVLAMKEFSHPGGQDKVAIDINHAIQTTLTVARNEWKYVADLNTKFDPNIPPVPCLAGEFNQVILNLVTNAAHAITEKQKLDGSKLGQISIRTKCEKEWVNIQIEDSGCGVPEEIGSRIFEPFFTTKEVGRGTGQGLALAHSVIVKKHDGQIWFESKAGQGTTFCLRLPLNPQEKVEALA